MTPLRATLQQGSWRGSGKARHCRCLAGSKGFGPGGNGTQFTKKQCILHILRSLSTSSMYSLIARYCKYGCTTRPATANKDSKTKHDRNEKNKNNPTSTGENGSQFVWHICTRFCHCIFLVAPGCTQLRIPQNGTWCNTVSSMDAK